MAIEQIYLSKTEVFDVVSRQIVEYDIVETVVEQKGKKKETKTVRRPFRFTVTTVKPA